MILLFATVFFIILIGIITIIYYYKTNQRHKERLKTAEDFINEYDTASKCVKQSYLIICQRRYEHIMTFFNFQLTTLIISKKPGNTGISRDIRTEFTTDLLLSD